MNRMNLDCWFGMKISKAMENWLNEVSASIGESKSNYVRNLIRKDMQSKMKDVLREEVNSVMEG